MVIEQAMGNAGKQQGLDLDMAGFMGRPKQRGITGDSLDYLVKLAGTDGIGGMPRQRIIEKRP